MRRIILIIFASIMFASIGFAEIRLIEKKKIRESYQFNIETYCIDGYKFVVAEDVENTDTFQVFEERDGKSLPAKC